MNMHTIRGIYLEVLIKILADGFQMKISLAPDRVI
uniref:Uncharacterized protein n=1 Tax=Cryptococcus bacillisporus CA1280 TaxID=1296109 RepID=A0A0D0UE27_CRYGA|nr:hypothetical protein I312_04015 [Cryptococcus bacillisporus CA1280]